MRQPNFHQRGPGGHAQAGFQKVDKQKRQILWRLTQYVLKNYKFSCLAVMACFIGSVDVYEEKVMV